MHEKRQQPKNEKIERTKEGKKEIERERLVKERERRRERERERGEVFELV